VAAVTVGAKPGEVNLTGKRGDRWGPFEFTAQEEGVDLSGTWIAQGRATKDRPAEVLCEIEVDDSDAEDGVIRVTILPDESSNLVTGPDAGFQPGKATYYWDAQRTKTGDPTDVKTWFAGKLVVDGDVAGDF
jgi:hypothetical protein